MCTDWITHKSLYVAKNFISHKSLDQHSTLAMQADAYHSTNQQDKAYGW